MKNASISDKECVVSILTQSFLKNPTLLYLIRNKRNKERYIKRVVNYAFNFAIRREGVFLSENRKGVAICFQYNYMKQDYIDIIRLSKAIISAFSIRKLLVTAYHNYHIEKQRPSDGRYLYFWFFGVDPQEQPKQSAKDLATNIIKMSNYQELDIYAETTLEQNKRVYERYGFEVYKHWQNPINKINVWFMHKSKESKFNYISPKSIAS
jgi:ribosomal protein S18 acetylase RimI-like enzyme